MLRHMALLFDKLFPNLAFLEWYIQLISIPHLSRLSNCSHLQNVAFDVHPLTVDTVLAALYERISLPCCPENNRAHSGCFILPSLFSVETSDADLRPILLDQQRNVPCAEVCVSADSSAQHSASGELPFMHMAGRSSAQNRRRLGHHGGRSRWQSQHSSGSRRSPSDSTQLALPSPALHHERLDTCPPPAHSAPLPLLARTGRIYSMQNIFQTMYLLGQVLFHRVQNSLQDSVSSSSQEVGAAPEEVIAAEAAAMKKELARISERLCVLEEQHKAWRKEEPLVYSMLLSACLVNTWLWLWR
ncbi:uncharacterized protein LOC122182821 isoform X1 [Lagopus leucura]|uniref:uncharacterized protein LOC122182821 isoform X1 n=1 Tax=Lagopus leucura TaxID=30410 RepID=UPI001C676B54|nr:uncharacterized protein LOC122182821 isoform X1 [Lagopus leucura]